MICLNADVVILWTRLVLTIHLKEDTDTMTDTTEQFVLMNARNVVTQKMCLFMTSLYLDN